jgi:hypothetical protein
VETQRVVLENNSHFIGPYLNNLLEGQNDP